MLKDAVAQALAQRKRLTDHISSGGTVESFYESHMEKQALITITDILVIWGPAEVGLAENT